MRQRSLKPVIKPGYSLVELLVVLGVVAILGLMSVPNLFGNNERYSLDNSAKKIQQMLLDAKTRSIAPAQSDASGYAQVYQVSFGAFPTNTTGLTAVGTTSTNTATLYRGLASCGNGVSQGSLVTLRTLRLPRNVYVSSFYPNNKTATDPDTDAAVRFSVGKFGFSCGRGSDPSIDSTYFEDDRWSGTTGSGSGFAQFLIIEVSSKKTSEKRYVAVDRLSGEVRVNKLNPQSGFTPYADEYPPLWTGAVTDSRLNVVCRVDTSALSFSFPRAKDASNEKDKDNLANADPNRVVYYDIYWKQGDTDTFRPLVSKYFHALDQGTVSYNFSSSAVNITNQPTSLIFQVWSFDNYGNYSESRVFTFNRAENGSNPNDWHCSSVHTNNLPTAVPDSDSELEIGDVFNVNDNAGANDVNNGSGVNGQINAHNSAPVAE